MQRPPLALFALLIAACAPTPDEFDGGDDSAVADARADASSAPDTSEIDVSSLDASEIDASALDVRERDGTAADSDASAPMAAGPTRYPAGTTQSPITEGVQRAMRAIAARARAQEDVFVKVGDSQSVYESAFTVCFAGANVDLAGRAALMPTIAHFRAGRIAGSTPYERRSLATTVGWSSGAPLAGSPAPLDQELAAANGRFALVMFGSNDSQLRNLPVYGENLWEIAERAIARGAIPLITSAPPRGDSMVADQWIPWYAHVARAVAQSAQTPFIDMEREWRTLPNFGLTTADNLHLNRSSRGACSFATADLQYGQNRRNLRTIEALDRVRTALAPGASAPDADTPGTVGEGSASSPFVIDGLPFADRRDTARMGASRFDRYSCSMANEGGRELVYRLALARPTRVHALVLDRGAVDVDLHRLTALDAASCAARDDRQLVADLPAGTHYFVVDSYVGADGSAREGEYIFVAFAAQ